MAAMSRPEITMSCGAEAVPVSGSTIETPVMTNDAATGGGGATGGAGLIGGGTAAHEQASKAANGTVIAVQRIG